MKTIPPIFEKLQEINFNRRRFLGSAAVTVAAAQFGILRSADAQSFDAKPFETPAIKRGTNTSFASLKQIDAGLLNVGYAEDGPVDGPAVILLHGWPYDIYSFVDVTPLLASAGYHVIVPYLRGYGTTSFLSSATMRNGQLFVQRDHAQRPAVGGRCRHHRSNGCAEDSEGHCRRL